MARDKSPLDVFNTPRITKQQFIDITSKNSGGSRADSEKLWNILSSNTSSSSSSSSNYSQSSPLNNSSSGGFSNSVPGRIFNTINSFFKDGFSASNDILKASLGDKQDQYKSTKFVDIFAKSGLNVFSIGTEVVKGLYGEITEQIALQANLLNDVNSKTGISGELSEKLRDDMKEAAIGASKYGFNLRQVGELYTSMSESSGKFALINKSLIDDAAPLANVLGNTLGELGSIIGDYETRKC